ncbi:hypothetical protein LLY41_17170 [Cytobacillus firmus]|uniref:hypothetical protein n=1 Tax=Cytobacillus firmus TaxID=1399 RepID=UPI0021860317|nr:hypothetical protein [Cytobacillus firmus]URM32103.1 hypothetical protein LLY41_17170 [Cytobacillus firmus]
MISKQVLIATSVILTVTGIFVASNIYTLIPIYGEIADSFKVNENHIVAGEVFLHFFMLPACYSLDLLPIHLADAELLFQVCLLLLCPLVPSGSPLM